MASTQVAVIGAGIVGLSTTYVLQRRGVDVRCFESGRPGDGQSAGRTRIFRHAHARPELAAFAAESGAAWEEWERAFGVSLLGREGLVVTGEAAGERARLLIEAGLPHRLIDRAEQARRLPILDPPEGDALLDEAGGSTDVRTAVEALSGAVADRLVAAEVFSVDPGEPASVETSEGLWRAERVIVCAGVGVRRLAPSLGLDLPVSVGLHARARFNVRRPLAGRRLPALQELSGVYGETVYGGPVPGEARYVIGLGGPDSVVADGHSTDDLVRRIAGYARRALPGLDPDPYDVRLCLSTGLSEEHDDFRLWRAGSALVLAGDNMFKFAPLLGRVLAGAAAGEEVPDWLEAEVALRQTG
jgi:sarcosine oxidase